MSSLPMLYFHTHSHLLGSCSEGRAICRVCQLSLTRAQTSCLWLRSYSPNPIWVAKLWLLPRVTSWSPRRWSRNAVAASAADMKHYSSCPTVGLSPCRTTSLLRKEEEQQTILVARPSPPGDAYHIVWANWEN